MKANNNSEDEGGAFEEEYLDDEFEQSNTIKKDFWDPPKSQKTQPKSQPPKIGSKPS